VWEKISFAQLSRMDLLDLIAIGRESKEKEIDERTGVDKAVKILLTTLLTGEFFLYHICIACPHCICLFS